MAEIFFFSMCMHGNCQLRYFKRSLWPDRDLVTKPREQLFILVIFDNENTRFF